MYGRKGKKRLIAAVCTLLLILGGIFWGHETYREKSLLNLLPLSLDDVQEVELRYLHGDRVELDDRQISGLCSVLEGVSLKFVGWSNSVADFYASAILGTDSPIPGVEILLSRTGYIAVNDFYTRPLAVYTVTANDDILYQFFDDIRDTGTVSMW